MNVPIDYQQKPASSTMLTLLSALVLLVVAVAAAALPLSIFATDPTKLNPLSEMGISNTQLIGSVPLFGVILVILAWITHSNGKAKAAKIIAATPLFWGMAVFFMMLPVIA